MNREQFIELANSKHAVPGLPGLDHRDLPELARLTNQPRWLSAEYHQNDADNPGIKEFLLKKQGRIQDLQKERTCLSCQRKFAPASDFELYLYCELRFPPPQDYCPECLNRIMQLLDSRESPESFRCC